MIRVALTHLTRYRYDRWVTLSPQLVRLRPAPHCRTPVPSYSLRARAAGPLPELAAGSARELPGARRLSRSRSGTSRSTSISSPRSRSRIRSTSSSSRRPSASRSRTSRGSPRSSRPFLEVPPPGPRLAVLLAGIDRSERRTVDFLVELNRRLSREIRYEIRLEPGVQTPEETLERAAGSCRDTAWLLVQVLRHLGLAARFVSGYLIQLRPDEKPLEGPAGAEADFTDLHAWTEVYLPGAGWIGLDPTSGLLAGEGHLPLAATPEPASRGADHGRGRASARSSSTSRCRCSAIYEDPRVTLPYDDASWARIDALGERIDAALVAGDVRLTLGRRADLRLDRRPRRRRVEPRGARPDQAAARPRRCLRRIAGALAPGALLHLGQGKWYPGEPLPRWALSCFWRRDGVPIWRDPELVAGARRRARVTTPATRSASPRRSPSGSASTPHYAIPAYEDPWHFIREEGRLPLNVDADRQQARRRRDARAACAACSSAASRRRSGTVLPLAARRRRARAGLAERALDAARPPSRARARRLADRPAAPAREPAVGGSGGRGLGRAARSAGAARAAPAAIPTSRAARSARRRGPRALRRASASTRSALADPDRRPAPGESARWVVRTALAVEAREGRLHVFMPPLHDARGLPRARRRVEDDRAALGMPVVVEGYPPPPDPRLAKLSVTPDPGVIEVNVRPAASWRELVRERDRALRRRARARASAPRSSCSTGATPAPAAAITSCSAARPPADSPILRRPDLLAEPRRLLAEPPVALLSLLGSLRRPHQPGAAGRRGATRQRVRARARVRAGAGAGRGRAARRGSSTASSATCSTDVTGNTHRAEFCIDKLYAPESATGRLGLVELRAFEMPPHARMSLVQQLLLRALVARFWREPYRRRPVRWGTQLHDRFLLPHFVDQDFRDVLDDLARAGYPLRARWFDPHFEFRFPRIGRVAHARRRARAAPRDRAVARARRGAGRAAARCATWTRRSSASRCAREGLVGERYVVDVQRPPRAAAADRARTASSWRASATAPGSRPRRCTRRSPCTRRSSSISSTRWPGARSAAAPTTSRIRAGATTRRSR